jgi:L-seryl-tRNA(Ser) seleniumtransferase
LEFDLERGVRGSRLTHAEALLRQLTGAEAALVVNNNAGAVLLCLSALASHRKVIISRSQLVEIGGGFRIPDVMKQSGARLVEVGTTNRVNIEDYETAIQEGAAMVLRAHSSNFKLVGFIAQPTLKEIITLSHRYNLPVLDDIGSGALLDTSIYGLAQEPMVQQSIEAGADIVCFSGDKLLGGPQSGIIVGKKEYLQRIKKHPMARALRIDKLSLAALIATLRHYLVGDADREIPVWRMIATDPVLLKNRVDLWRSAIGTGEVIAERSTIGGGSLPEETLPTFVLALDVPHVNRFVAGLRQSTPPLICRVQNGRVLFDPRTVQEKDDLEFIKIIKQNLLRS